MGKIKSNSKWALLTLFVFIWSLVLSCPGLSYAGESEDTQAARFSPGEGGNMPEFTPFEPENGKIGSLYIQKNHRTVEFYYNGNPVIRHNVEMAFIPPDQVGANSYTLQYSSDGGKTWNNYKYKKKKEGARTMKTLILCFILISFAMIFRRFSISSS